jgi:hypothetical protein
VKQKSPKKEKKSKLGKSKLGKSKHDMKSMKEPKHQHYKQKQSKLKGKRRRVG